MASRATYPARKSRRLAGSARRIVFHHIPKTAGTSLHQALVSNFAPEKICPERFANLDRFTFSELSKYELFSGHFDKYNVDLVPSPKRVFTFVREPRSRIVSLYKFWRSFEDEVAIKRNMKGPLLAKSMSFLEFLRNDDIRVRLGIDNVMARTFLGRSNLLNLSVGPRNSVDFLAKWAFTNVRRYNFVGVMERSDEDFAFLFELLELRYEPTSARRNVGPIVTEPLFREEEAAEVERELERLTAIDRIIYDRILAHGTRVMCPYPL
jgi:hypothetical protein